MKGGGGGGVRTNSEYLMGVLLKTNDLPTRTATDWIGFGAEIGKAQTTEAAKESSSLTKWQILKTAEPNDKRLGRDYVRSSTFSLMSVLFQAAWKSLSTNWAS